jgi:hypothetical protein
VKAAGNFCNKYDEETWLEPEWKGVLEKLGCRCENNIIKEFKN